MRVDRQKNEEGIVLVIVAVLLVALVGVLALAVDIGALYSARTSAQRVADAAALAGAYTFAFNTSADPDVRRATAISYAQNVATSSSLLGKPIALADVTFPPPNGPFQLRVRIESTQDTFFARALNVTSADIAVEAIAEAVDPAGKPGPHIVPWFLPNTIFSDCSACKDPVGTSNPPHTLVDGNPSKITAWAQSQLGLLIDPLKPSDPHDAFKPGEFFAIQMPNDTGDLNNSGDTYRDNIWNPNENAEASCGQSYPALPMKGDKNGPTKQGVDILVGGAKGADPTDTWDGVDANGVPHYITPAGTSDMSDAVVRVPIWDSCTAAFCPTKSSKPSLPAGVNEVTIVGFAWIFIDGHDKGGDVQGHLVGVTGCGGGGSPGAPFTPVPWLPPRLVHN